MWPLLVTLGARSSYTATKGQVGEGSTSGTFTYRRFLAWCFGSVLTEVVLRKKVNKQVRSRTLESITLPTSSKLVLIIFEYLQICWGILNVVKANKLGQNGRQIQVVCKFMVLQQNLH